MTFISIIAVGPRIQIFNLHFRDAQQLLRKIETGRNITNRPSTDLSNDGGYILIDTCTKEVIDRQSCISVVFGPKWNVLR